MRRTGGKKNVGFTKPGNAPLPNDKRGRVQDKTKPLPGSQDYIPGITIEMDQLKSIRDAIAKDSGVSRPKSKDETGPK